MWPFGDPVSDKKLSDLIVGDAAPSQPRAAPDTARIKENLGKMIDQGAPETDINAYLATEGFKSPDEWKAAINPAPVSDGMAKSFGQGLTLGTGDEIAATLRSAFPQTSNWMMKPSAFEQSLGKTGQTVSEAPTFQGRYDEELAKERQALKDFEAQNPNLAMGSEIAGNVVGGVALSAAPGVGALFRGSAGLGANVAKGVTGGALLGGAQGFGAGEGGFDNRIGNAGYGAAIGAGAGGAIPIVGKGASILYEKAAPAVLNRVANFADQYAPKVTPKSLSAAAPEGGQVTGDSLAATIADTSRRWAGNVEEDAAIKRLAAAISSDGGVGRARSEVGRLGEDAFLADTGRGAERLATVGKLTSNDAANKYSTAYNARNARTGQRFINAMGDEANVPSMFDAQQFLTKYRSAKGSEIYDPVLRQGSFNVSPEMDELLKVPAVKKAMDKVIADGAENGIEVGAAEAAHMVKQQLNNNVDAAFQSGNAVNKAFVRDIGDKWEQALWKANPAIKEADTAYAKVASLHDPKSGEGWLKRGTDFMKTGQGDAAVNVSPAALAADLPGATPEQLLALKVGSSNVMRDAAMSGPDSTRRLAKSISDNEIMQQKLTEIYGPERAAELMKRSAAERQYAAANSRVNAGSETADRVANLARETVMGAPPTSGGDVMGFLRWAKEALAKTDTASEPVRARLADLLANPSREMNAETLSLVEALLKRQALPKPTAGLSAGAAGYASNP